MGQCPLNNDLSGTPVSEQNMEVKPVVTKNWWFRNFFFVRLNSQLGYRKRFCKLFLQKSHEQNGHLCKFRSAEIIHLRIFFIFLSPNPFRKNYHGKGRTGQYMSQTAVSWGLEPYLNYISFPTLTKIFVLEEIFLTSTP